MTEEQFAFLGRVLLFLLTCMLMAFCLGAGIGAIGRLP